MRFRSFTPVVVSVIFGLLVLSIAACTGDSGAGPTPPEPSASPVATQEPSPPLPTPESTSAAPPAPTPAPTPIYIYTSLLIPTIAPTPEATSTPGPTPTPAPTSTPTPSPTPTPTPTPTPVPRWTNPTAPNALTKYLSGDFTDSDGDGMTDAAEHKYGFDPMDASSFPTEPEPVGGAGAEEPTAETQEPPEQHPINRSSIGAYYEVYPGGIEIKWEEPESGGYLLSLRTEGSYGWNIYYGGHKVGRAEVYFSEFNLSGDETLVGYFGLSDEAGEPVADFPYFRIDLSELEFPEPPAML